MFLILTVQIFIHYHKLTYMLGVENLTLTKFPSLTTLSENLKLVKNIKNLRDTTDKTTYIIQHCRLPIYCSLAI